MEPPWTDFPIYTEMCNFNPIKNTMDISFILVCSCLGLGVEFGKK